MLDKIKQLMEVKKQAEQMKRELGSSTIKVDEGRGIRIAISGLQNFQSIEIDESLLGVENKRNIESELLRSINAAIRKSQETATDKMKAVTGLNIPGL